MSLANPGDHKIYFVVNNSSEGIRTLFLFIRLFSDPRIIQSTLPAINLSYLKLFVKLFWLFCRCSMIMSGVNWSVKMSVWRDGKETDLEHKRAEAVKGH